MKIAIVLMVKDEAEDILPWLCWYLDLGVNTILLFDDSSTDGTFEIALEVSRLKDIRVEKLAFSLDLYTKRQQQCYQEVLRTYAEEFDWIGFFDADEYLLLSDGRQLIEFLDRDDLVGAVAVNWCNYGSSGHVTKPSMPPFWVYNQHYEKNDRVNQHVKSFIRPKYWTGIWHNVHFFDISPYLYDDPNGDSVKWSPTYGIIQDEPSWDQARIMHYQCRSMEHFVERVRKRPDIPAHPSLWATYDHGEVTDNSSRSKYRDIASLMRLVVQSAISRIVISKYDKNYARHILIPQNEAKRSSTDLQTIKKKATTPLLPGKVGTNTSKGLGALKVASVRTHFGTEAYLMPDSKQVCSVLPDHSLRSTQRFLALSFSDLPETVFLFAEHFDLAIIDEDARLADFRQYTLFPVNDTPKFALRHPSTKLFLSSTPANGGTISASRHLARDWEHFELNYLDEADVIFNDSRIRLLRAFTSKCSSIEAVSSICESKDFASLCSIYPVLAAISSPKAFLKLKEDLGALKRYVI